MRDGIFISYRTDDSAFAASLIHTVLKETFGEEKVFLDSTSLELGRDFRGQLWPSLRNSAVVLVVIGPHWLYREDGSSRLTDEGDFVRLEIAEALTLDVPVIPVLLGETKLPKPDTLPDDVRELSFRQFITLPARNNTYLLKQLTDRIGVIFDTEIRAEGSDSVPPYSPRDAASSGVAALAIIGAAVAMLFTGLQYDVAAWTASVVAVVASGTVLIGGSIGWRPRTWRLRWRLERMARADEPEWRARLAELRRYVRRRRSPWRPPGLVYGCVGLLMVVAVLAIVRAPAAACVGQTRTFGFDAGGVGSHGDVDGWDIRYEDRWRLGTAVAFTDETASSGAWAQAFTFTLTEPPLDKAQVKVEGVPLRSELTASVLVPAHAPAPLRVAAFVLEEIQAASGTQWIYHWTDHRPVAAGRWTNVRFTVADFTHSSSDPPHPSPPLAWGDPPRMVGLEFRADGERGLAVPAKVVLDDITIC